MQHVECSSFSGQVALLEDHLSVSLSSVQPISFIACHIVDSIAFISCIYRHCIQHYIPYSLMLLLVLIFWSVRNRPRVDSRVTC